MTARWLDKTEERAWRGYRRVFTMLEAQLAAELLGITGLSMADYTVLSNLVEAEGRGWRVTELADHMRWSQSRLSHQIRRMQDRGLVTKHEVLGDARGSTVSLSRQGLKAIADASPVHFAGVREHMIEVLTREQLKALGDITAAIISHLNSATNDSA